MENLVAFGTQDDAVLIVRSPESTKKLKAVGLWVIGAAWAVAGIGVLQTLSRQSHSIDLTLLVVLCAIAVSVSVVTIVVTHLCRSDFLRFDPKGVAFKRCGVNRRFLYEDIREVLPLFDHDPSKGGTRIKLTRRRLIDIPASLMRFDEFEPVLRSMIAPSKGGGDEPSGADGPIVVDRTTSRWTLIAAVVIVGLALVGCGVVAVANMKKNPSVALSMLKLAGAVVFLTFIGFSTASKGFKVKLR